MRRAVVLLSLLAASSALGAGRPRKPHERRSGQSMRALVEIAGGAVERGRFVTRPGIGLLARSQVTPQAAAWLARLGIPTDHRAAEYGAATFLLAGIGLETSMELVAHSAEVARLTSSKTTAMDLPFLRIQGVGPQAEAQKRYSRAMQRVRTTFEREGARTSWADDKVTSNELFNRTVGGHKATALTYTMPIVGFHKMFMGRMGAQGNEAEVREVVRDMSNELRTHYPQLILEPADYERVGVAGRSGPLRTNAAPALASRSAPPSRHVALIESSGGRVEEGRLVTEPGVAVLATSQLTPLARQLLDATKVDTAQPEADQLLEFRARLTYLSFNRTQKSSAEFNRKMVRELNHLSVTTAENVTVALSGISANAAAHLVEHGRVLKDWTRGAVDERAPALYAASGASVDERRIWRQALDAGAEGLLEPHRATNVLFSANLQQLHRMFTAVLSPASGDSETRRICLRLVETLHPLYPLVLRAPAWYQSGGKHDDPR